MLSDDEGLLLVDETQAVLDDAARGGIAAQVDGDDTCVQRDSPNDVNDHFLVRVGTPVKASLRSGQSTDLTVGGQDLTFLVAGAYRTRDCADGCGDLSWLVTRRTP